MSEFQRLKRIIKSVIPHYPSGDSRQYSLGDARMMITDLAMGISPEALETLTRSDKVLDDFNNCIYELEHKLDKRIVTSFATIETEFEPKAYEEKGVVTFTILFEGEEWIFAEYEL